jgi:hypothetical protein
VAIEAISPVGGNTSPMNHGECVNECVAAHRGRPSAGLFDVRAVPCCLSRRCGKAPASAGGPLPVAFLRDVDALDRRGSRAPKLGLSLRDGCQSKLDRLVKRK